MHNFSFTNQSDFQVYMHDLYGKVHINTTNISAIEQSHFSNLCFFSVNIYAQTYQIKRQLHANYH